MDPEITQKIEQEQKNNKYTAYVIVAAIIGLALLLGAVIISVVILFASRLIINKLNTLNTSPNSLATSQNNGADTGPVNITLSDQLPRLGTADAPVVIVEYADYQCPFCERFFSETFTQIKKDYIDTGKARFYYQDFAFLGEESQFAAEAAKCANEQGKFWEYHDYLYTHQNGENEGAFTQDKLKAFGTALGLDPSKFNSCVDSRIYKPDVEAEAQAGNEYGVSATPSLFIDGVKIEGAASYATYKEAIEKALNK